MASGLDQAIKKVMGLCRAHPDGLPQEVFDEEIPDMELLMHALNFLHKKPVINRALKHLEGRRLIKAVRTVSNKNRKVYMLFDLTPPQEVRGGVWYSEQEFDTEFVDVIKQHCLQFIEKQPIADAIRKLDISQVKPELEDFKQIMDTLVLDGDVEVAMGGKPYSIESSCYRIAKSCIPEMSALANVPCEICSVLHKCSPGGLISPEMCVYLNDWLSF